MYAIIEDSGRQFKVSPGDALLVDLREIGDGQKQITFDRVLLVGAGDATRIGVPLVAGASVSADILDPEMKMPKVRGIKFSRRKGYMKRWGHRQRCMKVRITAING